jgi:hypothetical protein
LPRSIGGRSVLTVFETAIALRCTGQHIRKLYDAHQLRAVDIASPKTSPSPGGEGRGEGERNPAERQYLRIARESLVAFVTIRLARQNNITL